MKLNRGGCVRLSYHVKLVLIHHDASTKKKGKREFVLLKQAAAHIAVQAEGEKFIDVGDSLLHYVCERQGKVIGGQNCK